VSRDKQMPKRPDEILAKSRRGLMFWATLVRCWAYDSQERPTADDVETLVRDIDHLI
jgi:hypothetical protein